MSDRSEGAGERLESGADVDAVPAEDAAGLAGPWTSRALDEGGVREVVARNFIGTLATVGSDQPYVVPFIYGYDDEAFYALLAPGRKVRNLEANPRVCITIVETAEGGDAWRSVVVTGRASRVEGLVKLGHALNTIRKQYPGNPIRSAPNLTALRAYFMLRVDADEWTGTVTPADAATQLHYVPKGL